MSSKAILSQGEYNAKDASMGAVVDHQNRIEQLKQQLQDVQSQLVAARNLLTEIVSPTNETGRTPLMVYYTDCRQEIDSLQTEKNRLYFLLGNDRD